MNSHFCSLSSLILFQWIRSTSGCDSYYFCMIYLNRQRYFRGQITVVSNIACSICPEIQLVLSICLFIWFHQVLVVAHNTLDLHCTMKDLSLGACGIQFLDQGLNPGSRHWEHEVLANGSPGSPQKDSFFVCLFVLSNLPYNKVEYFYGK